MPTTTNSELIAILRSRKTPGALTKMNRKQLEALVESTGGTPRPSAPTSGAISARFYHCRENDELKKLLDQERTEVAGHIMKRMLMATEIENLKEENEKLKAEAIISQDSYVQQYKEIEKLKAEQAVLENHLEQDEYLKERIAEEEDENQQLEKIVHGHLKTIEELKTKHSQELALISGRSAEYKKELTEFKEKLENVEEELENTEEDVEFCMAFANQEKDELLEQIGEVRDYIELMEDKNLIDVFKKIFEGTEIP